MTNSQIIAHQVDKRCQRQVEHQLVVGNDKYGSRTKQVAEYPVGVQERFAKA